MNQCLKKISTVKNKYAQNYYKKFAAIYEKKFEAYIGTNYKEVEEILNIHFLSSKTYRTQKEKLRKVLIILTFTSILDAAKGPLMRKFNKTYKEALDQKERDQSRNTNLLY